jgi:hypothetical protein
MRRVEQIAKVYQELDVQVSNQKRRWFKGRCLATGFGHNNNFFDHYISHTRVHDSMNTEMMLCIKRNTELGRALERKNASGIEKL